MPLCIILIPAFLLIAVCYIARCCNMHMTFNMRISIVGKYIGHSVHCSVLWLFITLYCEQTFPYIIKGAPLNYDNSCILILVKVAHLSRWLNKSQAKDEVLDDSDKHYILCLNFQKSVTQIHLMKTSSKFIYQLDHLLTV